MCEQIRKERTCPKYPSDAGDPPAVYRQGILWHIRPGSATSQRSEFN